MKSSDIRTSFTDFFLKNDHQKIPSSSLVPEKDPTLLFANAGMNQFKDYFTGQLSPPHPRATTIQKVVRAGGKHNDLENVGMTARHHTFFEMLGNFSFGDYFKKEAIHYAWDYLTKTLSIPKERLYITVHEQDDEAYKIWKKEIGLKSSRIFKKGDKDNFWEMGETGPCGPCSEIFFDHGEAFQDPHFNPQKAKDLLEDEHRYVEIWNLVFMQFEKTKEGRVHLPNPSIDTGAGLERLSAVMQGVYWNYDTDLFVPIIENLRNLIGVEREDDQTISSLRVVADHIRSSTMLITDGVLPSSEGRGYVLRRIIRRAVRHLRELGAKESCLFKLVEPTFALLGEEYPQNKSNASLAIKFLKLEEEKFKETLDQGLRFLHEEITSLSSGKKLSGTRAFKLYDTFGFPLDLTEVILREKGLSVDTQGFDQAMREQKERSKKSWKGSSSAKGTKDIAQKLEKIKATHFTGYTHDSAEASLLSLISESETHHDLLVFDQTPFYAEGGGQVGDQGVIEKNGKICAQVIDTQKTNQDHFLHIVEQGSNLKMGEKYTLKIDKKKRELTKRNHSATHLLQAALIQVLGPHIKQAGSFVNHEKLRFDFTQPEGLSELQIKEVENLVNQNIQASLEVQAKVMNKDQAIKDGALAFFGDKYGDSVRTLKMGKFSYEFCGGTHVSNTSEIALFKVIQEGSLSSGVRRLEALTSTNAINWLEHRSELFQKGATLLKSAPDQFEKRLSQTLRENKENKKALQELQDKLQALEGQKLFDDPIEIAPGQLYKSVVFQEQGEKPRDLRKMSDQFMNRYPKGVVLLCSRHQGKASLLLRSPKKSSLNCGKILGEVLKTYEGRGGGRPDMAQGLLPKDNHIDQAVHALEELVKQNL